MFSTKAKEELMIIANTEAYTPALPKRLQIRPIVLSNSHQSSSYQSCTLLIEIYVRTLIYNFVRNVSI